MGRANSFDIVLTSPNKNSNNSEKLTNNDPESKIKIKSGPPALDQLLSHNEDPDRRRTSIMSTEEMFNRDRVRDSDNSSFNSLTRAQTEAFNISPHLTNEDIRGMLACHIVGSLVALIEREERLLKRKINELIKKQFDFLLGDISRIFSEIPHFQGIDAKDFKAKLNEQKS